MMKSVAEAMKEHEASAADPPENTEEDAREEMIARLRSVAGLRREEAKLKALKAEKAAEAFKITEKADHAYAKAKDALEAAEDELRALAVACPSVKVDGIEVVNGNVLEYEDYFAIQWIVQHGFPILLKLGDRKGFEKAAQATGDLCPREVKKAKIASNLSQYLSG
jgi:hypothetical protein